jgi:predicted dehydrogenase
MTNMVSLAVVGAGYWGQKLLPKFLSSSEGTVRVVCDLHPGKLGEINKKFPAISTTDSYDRILSDQAIAAVALVTPPATHFSLARRALEAGKHVWIEKPLALTMEDGRELARLSHTKRKVLFVDHTFLYDPAIRKIRDLIAAGELGDIYHLYSQRLNLGRIKRDSNVWWNSAPHDVSIVLYLLAAEPRSITLHGYRYLQPNLEDLNMAIMEMAGSASVFVYHNWLFPENSAKLTVVGSKKMLVYEGKFEKRAITFFDYIVDHGLGETSPKTDLPTTIPSKVLAVHEMEGVTAQEPLALAVSDFLGSIREGRAPVSDSHFSLRVLQVLEAGERSLKAGGAKIPISSEF